MKASFVAFAVLGSANAQDDAMTNSTPSLRSLLSPRDSLSSTGAPKLSGTFCGWAPHHGHNAARVTFSGDKMHLEWKKKDGTTGKGCKDGNGPEHACCLCGVDRKMDCKDVKFKVSQGGELTGNLGSDGYDVAWSDSCIEKVMGKGKTPNGVPLRIKIHDEGHLDLLECSQQDNKKCDGAGAKVDLTKKGSDCDGWDGDHESPCRRRAGCKSKGLPVP